MAVSPWGKVYFQEWFAGILERQPGGRFAFTYDASYIDQRRPAVAHTLPLRREPHYCEAGLHPFFDNLVAEGWLRNAQARALGVGSSDRLALLLTFGRDCAGAISIVDPEPIHQPNIDAMDPEEIAALASRASLSGIQPKLFAVRTRAGYRPARADETSTHIAKLPSGHLPEIVEIEHLSTLATRALLPDDLTAETEIAPLGSRFPRALLVRRFDRAASEEPDVPVAKRHFEEFSQLLGKRAGDGNDKYDGSYEDMARFLRDTPRCMPAEADQLFRRVVSNVLIGNTDAHFKNFAMFHTADGLRLTPAYDLVAASLFDQYQTLALSLGGADDLRVRDVQPKHVIALGKGFGLSDNAITLAVGDVERRHDAARAAVDESGVGSKALRAKLIQRMDRRWTGTFASIGSLLSKRRNSAGSRSDSRKADSRR